MKPPETETNPQQPGSPSSPLYLKIDNWNEHTRRIEDDIRETVPFEGNWQALYDAENNKLVLPTEIRSLFDSGGVICYGVGQHLMLFGAKHWYRYARVLAKKLGINPVHGEVARHIYSSVYKFSKLNPDGSIPLRVSFAEYADLDQTVVIVGSMYHAEIHDKAAYLQGQTGRGKRQRLARFSELNI